ncbi:MAG: NYN domain-containing protein [Selenomonadaceae bacterium]|nr:NYN domain-containing protein [Selenomonadaceae bacterium]
MNAHVFVDAENVSPDVTFRVVEFFGREHAITKVDIVAKEDTLSFKYRNLDPKIFRVQNCFYGKNSADTWICIEIVRAIIDEPELELLIIISSDKDFLPAIKFAADYDKKIFIVSNGVTHKNFSAQMKTLGINPASVQLKDFRCGFDELSQKLSPFLPLMTYDTQKFFFAHGDEVRLILVRRSSGKICEVPFVEGISVDIFRRVLRELRILGMKRTIYEFCRQNFLKVVDEQIYFLTEEEILPPVTQVETVDKFLSRRAADVRKIFVKHAEKIFEIPFADEMPIDIFGKLLREKKIIGKTFSPLKVAEKSMLVVRNGKVFLPTEDELEKICDAQEDNVDKFFMDNAEDIRKIFVKQGQNLVEIPFVDGMSLEMFGKLLRGQKIISATGNPAKIAEKSLLNVRRGKVFLPTEDELEKNYEELSAEEKFFVEHAEDVRNVSVKHAGKTFELPFVDGMPFEIFSAVLSQRKIAGRSASIKKFAAKNSFVIRDGKVYVPSVYLQSQKLTVENPPPQKLTFEKSSAVDEYLNEHALQICTAQILHDGQKFSIPFVEGMPLNIFGLLLHERKIISGFTLPVTVAEKNSLVVRDEKIFMQSENLSSKKSTFEKSSIVKDYLNEHALQIRTAQILHDGQKFSIPFVDGMPLNIFGLLLHERKIISGFTLPVTVAEKNSLVVRDEKIFMQQEVLT